MENEERTDKMVAVPFSVIEEIMERLDVLQAQNKLIQKMISDDQVARMTAEYLDLEQAQQALHCKATTLEKLRSQGVLPFCQYGRKILIRRSDIDDFLEAHRENKDFREWIAAEYTSGLFPGDLILPNELGQ